VEGGGGGFDQVRYAFAPLWLPPFSVLLVHTVVLLEERELEERRGDEWRAYAARVPRYLPRSAG
jgi:protein-S-isoprenylcysteine O-methyltransferase Ste14